LGALRALLKNGRLGPPVFFCRHSGESVLVVIPAKRLLSSFRRKPESILILSLSAARSRVFVPVELRPPSLAAESLSLLAQRK